ncbi:MAG: phage tail sheath subtilisin-like domain-containing protein [Deltaproteobacteria bacterium]|nr:phage tail sheath subtilisin-like domain-containing protein [Deltaproteobacteria bacterium]
MPEYRTPGVYVEEISTGPRPVVASSTTDTGFVGILTLPTSFSPGRGRASGLFLPALDEQPLLSWNRALAFRPLVTPSDEAPPTSVEPAAKEPPKEGAPPPKPGRPTPPRSQGNRLKALVEEALPGKWEIDSPNGEDMLTLRSQKGDILRVPVRRSQLSTKEKEWDLAWGADDQQLLQVIASKAVEQGVRHGGTLPCADSAAQPLNLDASNIQARMQRVAPAIHTLDGFDAWRREVAGRLFVEILLESDAAMSQSRAESVWDALTYEARGAWERWVRTHPGMLRLELAVSGFFQNGGKTAYVSLGVQPQGAAGPHKRKLLEDSFDGVKSMALICAPGLDFGWQQAILEYAGPRGRGDLFAVLETPRYLLTRAPRSVEALLNKQRWNEKDSPYEVGVLETLGSPQQTELRFNGYAEDAVLDRCVPRDESGYGAAYGPWVIVDNPLSTGAHDRYVVAPPAGHIAGVIASTDLKAGGGVHKAPANELVAGVAELVTSISDREQEPLNMKGVNIIRHRPGAGIRVWGARTVASDPLWNYVNVRRLFLFVERSIRDAIQWAVFLPNTPETRGDLRTTIVGFLFRLYQEKMLDGSTWKEAFSVRCDQTNNADTDVRLGMLTVDVEIRPVYPAEFVRVRFRQSRVRGEIAEG